MKLKIVHFGIEFESEISSFSEQEKMFTVVIEYQDDQSKLWNILAKAHDGQIGYGTAMIDGKEYEDVYPIQINFGCLGDDSNMLKIEWSYKESVVKSKE